MAQEGTYAPGAVNDVELRVYVNDVLREHERVDFAGDTPGGLPGQVVSVGTGMLSRTGTITWAAPKGLTESAPHPIRQEAGWPPRKGDRLMIEAEVNGVVFRRFTGRLGKTVGALHDGTLQSDITDTLGDHLREVVTIDPRITGATGQSYRVAWEALEQARLGLLPQPDEGAGTTILHSVVQGDTWATVGSVASTAGATSTRDVAAGLTLWSGLYSQVEDVSRGGNSILLIARGSTTQDSDVKLRLTDGTVFRLNHQFATGNMQMYIDDVLVRETTWTDPGVPVLAFLVSFGFLHLWTSRTSKLQFATTTYSAKAQEAWGTRTAAIHVRYLSALDSDAIVSTTPRQPAALRLPTVSYQRLPATRGFENVPAKDVVDAWGESVLASVWMDEFGQTEVCSRAVMLARPAPRYVQMSERAFGGSWALGEDDVYSGVVVSGEQGAVRGALGPAMGQPNARFRVTVHQDASTRGYDAPAVSEGFVEAEADIDWGPIDTTPARAGTNWVGGELNGSWYGGIIISPDVHESGVWYQLAAGPPTYSVGVERLGQRTLKITETVGGLPANSTLYPRFATQTNAHVAVRGMPLPIIRAMWASTWAPYTRRANGGPSYAPALDHKVGWWLSPTDAQNLANALASEVTSPMATFSSIPLLWDPRRQIGDVENWRAQDGDGNDTWVARVLIVGYRESWDGHVPTQSVDARVISMTDPTSGKTYTDLAEAYDTYLDIASAGTYDQVHGALPSAT